MACRTPPPDSDAPGEKPEFTFHLIFKKSSSGASPGIVGAIVAGAVTAFIGEALGSAATDAHELKVPKKSPPTHVANAGPLAGNKKTKPKRRRRPAPISRKT